MSIDEGNGYSCPVERSRDIASLEQPAHFNLFSTALELTIVCPVERSRDIGSF